MYTRRVRADQRMKKKKVIKIVVLLAFIIMIGSIGTVMGRHVLHVAGKGAKDVFQVQNSSFEESIECRAMILTEEQTIYATHDGYFENMAKEGQKVRRNALIGSLVNNKMKTPIYSLNSGIFTMRTDGLEDIVPGICLQTAGDELFEYQPVLKGEGQRVSNGDVLCKVVDNLVPSRIIIEVPNSIELVLKPGGRFKIGVGENEPSYAVIQEVAVHEKGTLLLLQMKEFRQDFINKRYTAARFITEILDGSLIPAAALTEENGIKGVYCMKGDSFRFKNVELVKIIDDKALVNGLKENDIILSNSSRI
ncbi:MAG: HlyD family efflux transporter periplasmic adaptor subunit [Bacillota bacterium]|nr:HlyD family efflux transporter periplasmic adaptor subunit [Bacillota bacterium]